MSRWVMAPLLVALLAGSAAARANGRFPQAQAIASVPGSDGRVVFLRATFGVLVSRDTGKTWRWICERALGYEGRFDPAIATTRDGRLWVGLEDGLVSTTDGCDLATTPELAGHFVRDLTTDPRGETLWAITGAPGKRGYVWRRPPGKRFERLAGVDDTNLVTIEVAPSSPARVYVTGQSYATTRGRIFLSDDGGASLLSDERDGGASSLSTDGNLFLAAVDPGDRDRLFLRHIHAAGSDLLISRDAGRTLAKVLSLTSALHGFAKSADGTTYWAGSGIPEHGLFRSTDRGETFTPIAPRGVLCLHWAGPAALFFCDNALGLERPAISIATDARGEAVTPLARLSDVAGPVACARDAGRMRLCEGEWPATRDLLSSGSSAGRMDAGPAPPAVESAVDSGGPGLAPPARRSSCQCEAGAAPAGRGWGWAAALVVVVARRRRWV